MCFGDSAIRVRNHCLPFCTVTVLSYDRALSWTCIPEYKLVLKKKKKKNHTASITVSRKSTDIANKLRGKVTMLRRTKNLNNARVIDVHDGCSHNKNEGSFSRERSCSPKSESKADYAVANSSDAKDKNVRRKRRKERGNVQIVK
jgi:hypothetical protein